MAVRQRNAEGMSRIPGPCVQHALLQCWSLSSSLRRWGGRGFVTEHSSKLNLQGPKRLWNVHFERLEGVLDVLDPFISDFLVRILNSSVDANTDHRVLQNVDKIAETAAGSLGQINSVDINEILSSHIFCKAALCSSCVLSGCHLRTKNPRILQYLHQTLV